MYSDIDNFDDSDISDYDKIIRKLKEDMVRLTRTNKKLREEALAELKSRQRAEYMYRVMAIIATALVVVIVALIFRMRK